MVTSTFELWLSQLFNNKKGGVYTTKEKNPNFSYCGGGTDCFLILSQNGFSKNFVEYGIKLKWHLMYTNGLCFPNSYFSSISLNYHESIQRLSIVIQMSAFTDRNKLGWKYPTVVWLCFCHLFLDAPSAVNAIANPCFTVVKNFHCS